MRFKAWIEGIEEYEPYRTKIDSISYGRKFPFDRMFEKANYKDRVFIPFEDGSVAGEEKEFIRRLGEELGENGYEIVDIKKGYARQKGKPNNIRIGKLLDTLRYKAIKGKQDLLKSGKISQLKYNSESSFVERYFRELKEDFENMASRMGGEFEIVVSKNPHDLASMSTGRGWESCMDLAGGAHSKDVYCEVLNGGFVAYLIRNDDREIRRPIARVHIRRFDNKKGQSLAIPEETVYGKEVPGFLEKVRSWLDSMQGKVPAGPYRRRGGAYSDTYGKDRNHFVRPESGDKKKIMSWIKKWMGLSRDKKAKYYNYLIQALVSIFGSTDEVYPRSFVAQLKAFIFGENVIPMKGGSDHAERNLPIAQAGQFMSGFALRFPDLIKKEDFVKAFDYAVARSEADWGQRTMLNELVKKFPQFVDKELIGSIKNDRTKEVIGLDSPELDGHFKAVAEDEINRNLKIDNPSFLVSKNNSVYQVRSMIHNEMDKLRKFSPIPERLVSKLIEFAKNVDKLSLGEAPENHWSAVEAEEGREDALTHAIHVLSMTKTDTPSVQRFYESLLPQWNKAGGIGVLGAAIARLGGNGRKFIPFLVEKRKEFEAMEVDKNDEKRKASTLESFDYVIDSIQKGRPSDKHNMSHGENFDSWLEKESRRVKAWKSGSSQTGS